MSDQAPRISIIIPAKNEEVRLPASLREIRRIFPGEPWEILLVIEPGTDRTAEVARQEIRGDPRFQIVENPDAHGKGFAVKTGMLKARGEWVFFMDADLSVPLRCVKEFLRFTDGADVLMGSRRHPDSRIVHRQPLAREVAGRIFNRILRAVGATHFSDTQCGFKAFRREAAREIFSRVEQTGFGFDVEVMALAQGLGFRIKELPVEWADAPGSQLKPLRHGVTALLEAILAVRRVRRNYGFDAKSRSQH
ncbi:MAG: glycosyltransferase family 2 protein [Chthoniobacterales bacterium]|nr:glycosyltransferase family 2 protein [Chthoniobacterales bacterium]